MPVMEAGSQLPFADLEQEKPSSTGHMQRNRTSSGLISPGVLGGDWNSG